MPILPPPPFDPSSIDIEAMPALITSVTLSSGGYTVGPGSALSPGSYSLIENRQNLVVNVELLLKQFVAPNSSPHQVNKLIQQTALNLYVLVVATTDKQFAKLISERPSHYLRGLAPNSEHTAANGKLKSKRVSLYTAWGKVSSDALAADDSSRGNIDIPLSTTFQFEGDPNPDYLCLFAVSMRDTNADANMHIISQSDVTLGSPTTELVIKKGQLFTTSTLFFKMQRGSEGGTAPSESLWVGDTHQMPDGSWMTGDSHLATSQPLATKAIFNSKLADHRGVSKLERLQLNFDRISALEGISNQLRARMRLLEEIKKQSVNYLSDVSYSKDENNDLKLFFSVDYLNMLKNNGRYASLYVNSPQELLSSCSLLSMKVIRRRVHQANIFNKLTGGDSPMRIYDEKIDVVGDPLRARLGIANPGVLHYIMTDKQMDDITTGLYEYGIEMDILDDTKAKLENILLNPGNGLQVMVSKLESFLTESLLKGNYNVGTNRYTNKFINTIRTTYLQIPGTEQQTEGPWNGAVLQYLAAIKLLFGGNYKVGGLSVFADVPGHFLAPGSVEWVPGTPSLKSALLSIVDPITSGPSGIQFLIKLLNNFISSLRSAIGSDAALPISQATTFAPSDGAYGKKKRIVKIRQFFSSAFDSDKLIDLGLDFLNIGLNGLIPPNMLKYLSYEAWYQVVTVETSKMGSTDPLTTAGSSPSYLTPNFLRMPSEKPLNLYEAYLSDNPDVILDPNLTSAYSASYVVTQLESAFYRLLESNMTLNSPLNLSNANSPSRIPPRNMTAQRAATAYNKSRVMNKNSCVASTTNYPILGFPYDPINNVFDVPPLDLSVTAEDSIEPMDASIPLTPTSKFVTDAGAPPWTSANSGSDSTEVQDPTSEGSSANYNDTIIANASFIDDYLLQTDLFGGIGDGKPPPMSTYNGGTIFQGNNTTAAQFLQLAQGANMAEAAVSTANDLGVRIIQSNGKPAAIVSQMQSESEQSFGLDIAPQDEEFIEAFSAGALDPSKLILLALKYGFIYKAQYLAAYGVGQSGETLIKKPIWLNLRLNIVRSAQTAGKTLLCRLKKHQTLMKSFKGLKIPIYNEYFLIGPSGGAAGVFIQQPISNPIVPSVAPEPGLLASMLQYADSIDFANSYDEDVSPGSTPNPLEEYILHGEQVSPTQGAGKGSNIPPAGRVYTPGQSGKAPTQSMYTPSGQQNTQGGSTPSSPAPPTGVPAEREWKRFLDWYEQPISAPGLLGVLPRYAIGDGVFRPWTLPVPSPRRWISGMSTARQLRNGAGLFHPRPDILVMYMQETGRVLPVIPQ